MIAIPSWAVRGRKVVCVDGSPPPDRADHYRAWPEQGAVYTIREVLWVETLQMYQVRLVEIQNAVHWYKNTGDFEPAYALRRFKPLVTIEDDMEAHFVALLDVKQPSPVEA
jgi:hypothetical protein